MNLNKTRCAYSMQCVSLRYVKRYWKPIDSDHYSENQFGVQNFGWTRRFWNKAKLDNQTGADCGKHVELTFPDINFMLTRSWNTRLTNHLLLWKLSTGKSDPVCISIFFRKIVLQYGERFNWIRWIYLTANVKEFCFKKSLKNDLHGRFWNVNDLLNPKKSR